MTHNLHQHAADCERGCGTLGDALRRAHPTIDSPLGDLIAGKIDQAEYRRRLAVKRLREAGHLLRRLDPDPLTVPDDDRIPYHGWESMRDRWHRAEQRPVSHTTAVAIVAACAAVILTILVLALATTLDATPRPAPVIPSPGPSASAAATPGGTGRELAGAPQGAAHDREREPDLSARPLPLSGAPQPSGEVGPLPPPVAWVGWATWCEPTPTQCQSWAPPALLGAVPTFRFGDEPYDVVVTAGDRSVVVTVVSFCRCADRHGDPTVIDLSPAAMAALNPDWRRDGVLRVHVENADPPRHPDDIRMQLEVRDDEVYR